MHGIVLLVGRHPHAPLMFELTVAGFWRSLFAAVLVLPGHAYMVYVTTAAVSGQPYGFHAIATDLLIYIIVWLAYPAAMAQVASALGRQDRLLDYLVPYNWMSVPIAYALVLAELLVQAVALSRGGGLVFFAMVYGLAVAVLFDLARRQLDVSNRAAVGIVCFDLVLTVSIISILRSFAGR